MTETQAIGTSQPVAVRLIINGLPTDVIFEIGAGNNNNNPSENTIQNLESLRSLFENLAQLQGGSRGMSFQDFLNRSFVEYQRQHAGPPPASQVIVDSLEERDLTQEELSKQEECSICQDSFKEDDSEAINVKGVVLPCKHIYHKDCVLPWLKQHNTCPVCRTQLATDDPEYEQEQGRPPPTNPQRRTFDSNGEVSTINSENSSATITSNDANQPAVENEDDEEEEEGEEDEDVEEDEEAQDLINDFLLQRALRISMDEHEREQRLRNETNSVDQPKDYSSDEDSTTDSNSKQWECNLCTLHNSILDNHCIVCGTLQGPNPTIIVPNTTSNNTQPSNPQNLDQPSPPPPQSPQLQLQLQPLDSHNESITKELPPPKETKETDELEHNN